MSEKLACHECGKLNKAGARFCRGCGAKPKAADGEACFACQKVNPIGYKACKDCGAPKEKKKSDVKNEPKKSATKSCAMCGFKNDAGYDKCVKCSEENPSFAAEKKKAAAATEAAAKKKAAAANKPKTVAKTGTQDDLLKGVEFKTKVKGAEESSGIKLGDLTPDMRVWVTVGGDEGWMAARVIEASKDSVTVSHEGDGSSHDYKPSKVYIRNPPNLEGVQDLTQLSYMHEPGLLHILAERYAQQQIYTFTGQTLIAVNPYARLPIYGKETLDSYVGQPIGRMPPHIFAVAEDAFRSMMDFGDARKYMLSKFL